jgi:hypothetical protein
MPIRPAKHSIPEKDIIKNVEIAIKARKSSDGKTLQNILLKE